MTNIADTYASAVEEFRAACANRNIPCEELPHPERGPDGERLATHVARLGPANSSRVLILNTGTHGIEGLAGSMCLVSWLNRCTEPLPQDTSVMLIHLINPWGTAWQRRQTEGNVDLNRNFLNFNEPLPRNEAFESLQDALTAADAAAAPDWYQALCGLADSRCSSGEEALAHAVFGGQYRDPKSVGFGGTAPTWSNSTFRSVLGRHTQGARQVAFIDFHTGVGPYGYGTLLSTEPAGSAGLASARAWYEGPLVAMREDRGHMPYAIVGDIGAAVTDQLASLPTVPVTIEFGTYAVSQFMRLQLQDCWSHAHESPDSDQQQRLRQSLRDFFFPSAPEWRAAVETRALEVITAALEGLRTARQF